MNEIKSMSDERVLDFLCLKNQIIKSIEIIKCLLNVVNVKGSLSYIDKHLLMGQKTYST